MPAQAFVIPAKAFVIPAKAFVIPAKAGNQSHPWITDQAGMTN